MKRPQIPFSDILIGLGYLGLMTCMVMGTDRYVTLSDVAFVGVLVAAIVMGTRSRW